MLEEVGNKQNSSRVLDQRKDLICSWKIQLYDPVSAMGVYVEKGSRFLLVSVSGNKKDEALVSIVDRVVDGRYVSALSFYACISNEYIIQVTSKLQPAEEGMHHG